ncbi:MAG: UDP-N-acetyl-D-glucosamine dehydrogenase [Actinomycetota bacterium]|nr:UDP-N-acetyl-D-glucosamine dehydrogenase [Actinomycetota bacterium]
MAQDFEALLGRIEARSGTIGIVGLGYVGLPIAVAYAQAGFNVVGVDLREEKVAALEAGRSHLMDVPDEDVAPLRASGRLRASTSFEPLKEADAVIICVPTPLAKGQPDLSRVVFAGEELAKVLKPGSLFVLESTTYPGTTEELLLPLLEAGGLVAGEDFLLAYSPERIDPGNPTHNFTDIPKIVGGIDEMSTRVAAALYQQVVPKVVPVSGTREAEMSKLIENTFRHVNIALVNELALYSHDLGVDIWEAIEAAATKPFGFVPFWPGPGWGGHCIPLDPSYLSWRVRQTRSHEVRFVELAQAINSEMPRHVIDRAGLLLNDEGKSIRNAKILGVGVAYKGGTEDTRESAGLKILASLQERGAAIEYHDPLVPEVEVAGTTFRSIELTSETIQDFDLVVIFVPQAQVDWELLASDARRILDCCNALGRRASERITRL